MEDAVKIKIVSKTKMKDKKVCMFYNPHACKMEGQELFQFPFNIGPTYTLCGRYPFIGECDFKWIVEQPCWIAILPLRNISVQSNAEGVGISYRCPLDKSICYTHSLCGRLAVNFP